jgi:hypothetical protein
MTDTAFEPNFPALIAAFTKAAEARAEQEEYNRDNGEAWGGGELVDRQNAYIAYLRSAAVWRCQPIRQGYAWALMADGPGHEAESYGYVLGELLDAASQGLMPEGRAHEPWINEIRPGLYILEF